MESTGYLGPKLNDNAIWLKRNRYVNNIALGESHMFVQCTHVQDGPVVYVMGSNEWGQLGIDPFQDENSTFISKLEELKLVRMGQSKFVVD